MNSKADLVYCLIVEIRRAFYELKAYSDEANADIGVTTATRALLEYLADSGPDTVPEVGRAKNVTRQHVQQLAESLVRAGLAEWRRNP